MSEHAADVQRLSYAIAFLQQSMEDETRFTTYEGKRLDNGVIVTGNILQLDDGDIRIATSCLVDDDNPNIFTVCAYEIDKDTIKKVE